MPPSFQAASTPKQPETPLEQLLFVRGGKAVILRAFANHLNKDKNMKPDTFERYGSVSRFFHWSMALLFVFMYYSAVLFSQENFDLMPYHKATGLLLMLLILLRVVWMLANLKKRPHGSLVVKLGHLALYLLMLAVPAVGLIRQYGAARHPLEIGSFTLPQAAEKIEWMANLGNAAHGKLGWLLMAFAIGHVAMALVHQLKGEKLLQRMAGR